jgi:hypothetical protein
VFVVKSPSGIGQADIERQRDCWPESVVLRLRLKGLESFRATNGKVTLQASVVVQEGKPKVRAGKGGEGIPGLVICILAGEGKPANEIPLKDGYFEITLPKAFFEPNPTSITLNWIDFYRQ